MEPMHIEPVIEIELAPRRPAGGEARALIGRRLGPRLPRDSLFDLQAIVTELVNNAVLHGPGKPVTVSIIVGANGRIAGEVADHGAGRVAIREAEDGCGGYGLRLVDALATRWGVHDGTSHVWFELNGAPVTP